MSVASHWTNSLANWPLTPSFGLLAAGVGNDSRIRFAASRFRPTIMMLLFPPVCSAKVRTIPSPIPDVPPTKTATGTVEEALKYAALAARIVAKEGIEVDFWLRYTPTKIAKAEERRMDNQRGMKWRFHMASASL